MNRTIIAVELVEGRHHVRMRNGLLRAQRLHGGPELARVALVGQTALLLGGDEVELEVQVGAGARLELREIAGTVAYHGRGRPASWRTTVRVAAGASLVWAGEPFVIADGAEVTRTTTVELDHGAAARFRETIVLGRAGERGGRLRIRTQVVRAGTPVLVEDLVLDPADRGGPGLLGGHRVLDSLLELGGAAGCGPLHPAVGFRLVDPDCTLTRFLGDEVSDSPLPHPSCPRQESL